MNVHMICMVCHTTDVDILYQTDTGDWICDACANDSIYFGDTDELPED